MRAVKMSPSLSKKTDRRVNKEKRWKRLGPRQTLTTTTKRPRAYAYHLWLNLRVRIRRSNLLGEFCLTVYSILSDKELTSRKSKNSRSRAQIDQNGYKKR